MELISMFYISSFPKPLLITSMYIKNQDAACDHLQPGNYEVIVLCC